MGRPAWLDAPPPDPYPFEETTDVRHGPDVHPALLGLLPLLGRWRGRGSGGYPTMDGFTFGQELTFSHDGRPFLAYETRSWLLDAAGRPVRPTARETGFWRPVMTDEGKAGDEFEVLLAHPTGFVEIWHGRINHATQFELVTEHVGRVPSAKEVRAGKRLYGIVEGALAYVYEMAAVGQPMSAHLSARLERVPD